METLTERKGIVTAKGKPVTLVGPELKKGDKAPDFRILDTELNEKTLKDFSGTVKLISVTPSLDTSVCNRQARTFDARTEDLGIAVLNVSMDLPFALERFVQEAHPVRLKAFSDHREASFGTAYGVLMKELRLLARSVFVVDKDDVIRYVQIVPEMTDDPDFRAAMEALRPVSG
ncbi:MAG: thiol peroxidase [Nitrospirota bacterium]|jgi:thiol peroxidase